MTHYLRNKKRINNNLFASLTRRIEAARRIISGTENKRKKVLMQRRLNAMKRRQYGAKKRAAILKHKEKHFRRLAMKFNRVFHFQRRRDSGTVRPAKFWNNPRGKALKHHFEKAKKYISKARSLRVEFMRIHKLYNVRRKQVADLRHKAKMAPSFDQRATSRAHIIVLR
jgi:hypothetical protein